MSANQDRVLFALAHAGLAVGPDGFYDTARFVGALAEHGYSIVPPESCGSYWLESAICDVIAFGFKDGTIAFNAADALDTLERCGARFSHVDDPADEDVMRSVSDDALRREVLRRGLAFEEYEPTTGPTP